MRIGVILPEAYRGGTLTAFKSIVHMLRTESLLNNLNNQFIVYCIQNFYNFKEDFGCLLNLPDVKIREFYFVEYSNKECQDIISMSKKKISIPNYPSFYLICDHYKNGLDCDVWLLVSDRFLKPILPLRPYGIFVYDYIQRYMPNMFKRWFEFPFIQTARNANFIVTIGEHTALDAKNYAGINPERIICIQPYFPIPDFSTNLLSKETAELINKIENYAIWTTNCAEHKNHLTALDAIDQYYADGGDLNFVITGVNTEKLDPACPLTDRHLYIKEIRKKISAKKNLKEKIFILGNIMYADYINLIKRSRFLFHPAIIDNGTYTVLEAAIQGVPSISSDYPPMKSLNELYKLNLHFFDAFSKTQIVNSIKEMSKNYETYAKKLPSLLDLIHVTESIEKKNRKLILDKIRGML